MRNFMKKIFLSLIASLLILQTLPILATETDLVEQHAAQHNPQPAKDGIRAFLSTHKLKILAGALLLTIVGGGTYYFLKKPWWHD